MCDFCSEIITLDEMKDRMRHIEEYSGLVTTRDKTFHLYASIDDMYYSGIKFPNIQYCPYCGRKLDDIGEGK